MEVERAIPGKNGRDNDMPRPTSIDQWDGKSPLGGTFFKVNDSTYAMHTGQGAYVTLDASKNLHDQPVQPGS